MSFWYVVPCFVEGDGDDYSAVRFAADVDVTAKTFAWTSSQECIL
jgi:hypothetical protein